MKDKTSFFEKQLKLVSKYHSLKSSSLTPQTKN